MYVRNNRRQNNTVRSCSGRSNLENIIVYFIVEIFSNIFALWNGISLIVRRMNRLSITYISLTDSRTQVCRWCFDSHRNRSDQTSIGLCLKTRQQQSLDENLWNYVPINHNREFAVILETAECSVRLLWLQYVCIVWHLPTDWSRAIIVRCQRNGASGMCKLLPNCPAELEALRRGIIPTSCGYNKGTEFICCGSGTTKRPETPRLNRISAISKMGFEIQFCNQL